MFFIIIIFITIIRLSVDVISCITSLPLATSLSLLHIADITEYFFFIAADVIISLIVSLTRLRHAAFIIDID